MVNYLNRRSYTRFTYEVPVTLQTGFHKGKTFLNEKTPSIQATLSNYSRGGMYLESLYFLPQGTPITVTLTDPDSDPVTGEKKCYHTEVKWCRKIPGGAQTTYAIGVMYDSRVNHFIFGFGNSQSTWMMSDTRLTCARMS